MDTLHFPEIQQLRSRHLFLEGGHIPLQVIQSRLCCDIAESRIVFYI